MVSVCVKPHLCLSIIEFAMAPIFLQIKNLNKKNYFQHQIYIKYLSNFVTGEYVDLKFSLLFYFRDFHVTNSRKGYREGCVLLARQSNTVVSQSLIDIVVCALHQVYQMSISSLHLNVPLVYFWLLFVHRWLPS